MLRVFTRILPGPTVWKIKQAIDIERRSLESPFAVGIAVVLYVLFPQLLLEEFDLCLLVEEDSMPGDVEGSVVAIVVARTLCCSGRRPASNWMLTYSMSVLIVQGGLTWSLSLTGTVFSGGTEVIIPIDFHLSYHNIISTMSYVPLRVHKHGGKVPGAGIGLLDEPNRGFSSVLAARFGRLPLSSEFPRRDLPGISIVIKRTETASVGSPGNPFLQLDTWL